MSEDVQTGSQLEDEDDDYTLFGSPPPSPSGRSPSPTLALPGHGNGLHKRQNVGTIALPGSQPYSELPMNPLALSLSLPLASRPPAQGSPNPVAAQINAPQHTQQGCPNPVAAQTPAPRHPPQSPTPSTPSTSASLSKPRKKKKGTHSKSKESTPRPEITLPDPTAPPPANFLRNQSALLGTAGLVGGVRPSQLATNRYSRGTTLANPIVVDDDEEPPAIGKSRYRTSMNQCIDPSRLPAPSLQDIVSMLIGQKDIFPVLASILKLIANGVTSTPQRTGFERKTPSERQQQQSILDQPPPSKKRKLDRVPAGATDWDVPYPFPQGEGPEEYRQNWERERGKQLLAQLVHLIRIAARKAAMKNYHQKEENKKKLREAEENRKRAEREARAKASTSEVSLDKANEVSCSASNDRPMESCTESVCHTSPTASTYPSGAATPYSGFSSPIQTGNYSQLPYLPSQQSQDINQLISSLLASAPDPNLEAQTSTSGANQDLLDNWMNVFQSQQWQGQSSTACSSASTPAPDGACSFNSDTFDFTGLDFNMEDSNFAIRDCDLDAIIAPSPQPNCSDQTPTSSSQPSLASPRDNNCIIDPSLLDTSGVSIDGGMNQAPLLSPSPVPSTGSSAGHNDPATPKSTTWDAYRPNIFSPIENYSTIENIEPSLAGTCGVEGILTSNGGNVLKALDVKGKRKADVSSVPAVDIQMPTHLDGQAAVTLPASDNSSRSIPTSIPIIGSSVHHTQHFPSSNSSSLPFIASSSSTPSTLVLPLSQLSGPIGVRNSTKNDVLRRGKERKEQLAAELARIKTKLWETTIEQGALAHIVRHYNEVDSNNSSNAKS